MLSGRVNNSGGGFPRLVTRSRGSRWHVGTANRLCSRRPPSVEDSGVWWRALWSQQVAAAAAHQAPGLRQCRRLVQTTYLST